MWLDQQVSFYKCPADNYGLLATLRQVLLSRFAINHEWFYADRTADKTIYPKGKWINGEANDLDTIIRLRNSPNLSKAQKTLIKQTMQCFTPASVLKCKKKNAIVELGRTGLMQLDFDYADINEFDVEELKRALFDLPFVVFCGLSCSGTGFYALASIAEPLRLKEYAEHCFNTLLKDGIKADTTKGTNFNDLRYVSYDPNMLIKYYDPEPLQIKKFQPKPVPKPYTTTNTTQKDCGDDRKNRICYCGVKELNGAQVGSRWATVGKVAVTLGGLENESLLNDIINSIKSNSAFAGEEDKYIERAEVCFKIGLGNPLPVLEQ